MVRCQAETGSSTERDGLHEHNVSMVKMSSLRWYDHMKWNKDSGYQKSWQKAFEIRRAGVNETVRVGLQRGYAKDSRLWG